MVPEQTARVIDRSGRCARLAQPVAAGQPVVAVLESGGTVRIPAGLMVRQDGETYTLAARFEELAADDPAAGNPLQGNPLQGNPLPQDSLQEDSVPGDQPEMVIPVVAEQVRVHKERVVTGKVRLSKIVHQEEQTIDEPVLKQQVSVERVPIGRWVDVAPPIRSEGETLIVPVVEEVLVVEKRLRLREEVRVTWHHQQEHEPQHLVVRREEVRIERVGDDQGLQATHERDTQHPRSGTRDDAEPRP